MQVGALHKKVFIYIGLEFGHTLPYAMHSVNTFFFAFALNLIFWNNVFLHYILSNHSAALQEAVLVAQLVCYESSVYFSALVVTLSYLAQKWLHLDINSVFSQLSHAHSKTDFPTALSGQL